MDNTWLHRYAVMVAAITLLLVIAGGLVTSNNAGLSVPDWPLSYGKLMPVMQGGVLYEHGHRMIAALVGLLAIGLAIWLWRAEPRRWVAWMGAGALGLVILQGVLGGLTVLYLLPKPVSVAHACLAQLFFSMVVAIELVTSRRWRQGAQMVEGSGTPSLRRAALVAPLCVLAQLLLGAAVRHQASGIVPHILGAMLVSAFVFLVGITVLMRYGAHPALGHAARVLMTIAFFQVFLGMGAYISRVSAVDRFQPELAMIVLTVAHVAVGALMMAASVLLAMQMLRNIQRPTAV
jgi:cytochrome c oxidase assembly protein subunit 15